MSNVAQLAIVWLSGVAAVLWVRTWEMSVRWMWISRAASLALIAVAFALFPAAAEGAPVENCRPVATTVKHVTADSHQRQVIHRVLTVGRRKDMPNKVMRASIAAMTQESTARALKGGDGSSAGPFQLIANWGPLAKRMNPEWSGRWFFRNAITVYRRNRSISINDLAQAVERSGHPRAYGQWKREATKTYAKWLTRCTA